MIIDSFTGEYRFLSNFWWSTLYGRRSTVEHWFQAAKANSPEDIDYVLSAATPGSAKGRGRRIALRPDWEEVKLRHMELILREKFSDRELARKLVDTGDAELIEGNTWGDTYWGMCNDVGENHLGRLLMRVRADLVAGITWDRFG